MSAHVLDHLVFIGLAVVLPIHGRFAYRRFQTRVGEVADARLVEYRSTAFWLWLVFLVIATVWLLQGRDPALLGVRPPAGTGFWVALVVCLGMVGFLFYQWRAVRRSEDVRERARAALATVADFLPHSLSERRWFSLLALTAGIVEELAYRGFLIWYFQQFVDLVPALLLSAVAFGFAHIYQGVAGIVKTGLAGLVLALLYVGSGSIWVPMLLHWASDDIQGRTAFAALGTKTTLGSDGAALTGEATAR